MCVVLFEPNKYCVYIHEKLFSFKFFILCIVGWNSWIRFSPHTILTKPICVATLFFLEGLISIEKKRKWVSIYVETSTRHFCWKSLQWFFFANFSLKYQCVGMYKSILHFFSHIEMWWLGKLIHWKQKKKEKERNQRTRACLEVIIQSPTVNKLWKLNNIREESWLNKVVAVYEDRVIITWVFVHIYELRSLLCSPVTEWRTCPTVLNKYHAEEASAQYCSSSNFSKL